MNLIKEILKKKAVKKLVAYDIMYPMSSNVEVINLVDLVNLTDSENKYINLTNEIDIKDDDNFIILN